MKNNNLIECGVSFIVALFSYLIIGPIIYALIYPYINGTLLSYASLFIPSLFTLLVLVILKRKRLIDDFRASRDRGLSLPRFLIFLSSSFIFLSLTSLFEGAKVNPAPLLEKILSLFISLLFIPIQITIEEYIFRILPYKAVEEERMGEKRVCVLLSLISGLLFTLPHLFNKEVWAEGGYWAVIHYFLWGSLVMAGAIITKGFEFPLAMHLSNNLVVSIVANYKGSSLSSTSFFILENETSSPKAIMTFLLLFALEFIFFYTLKRRRHSECQE